MRRQSIHRVGIILILLFVFMPAHSAHAAGTHRPAAQTAAPPVPPGCPAVTSTTFTNNTATAIPTGPATVTSRITVSGANAYLWDLDVQTFITHTYAADLDITLQSPAGTTVTLTTDNGGSNDNVFNGTLWDDSADDPVTDHIYANLVLASPLSPEEPLAAFIGEDPNGEWIVTIYDDDAGDGGSLDSWSLVFTAQPVMPVLSAATSFNSVSPVAIPSGPGTVTSSITVSGADAYLWDLDVQTFITHTFAADLDITLRSPAGTTVTLTTDNGGSNDNVFNGTLWDDSAGDPVTDHGYTNLVLASPLSAEEPLAAFNGEDPNGEWIMTIYDDLAGDGGSLDNWSLNVTTASGCPAALTVTNSNPAAGATLTGLQTITATFSEDALSDGSARAANNPANYLLVERGANRVFDTISCAAGLAGDDITQNITSAAYDGNTFTATLNIAAPLSNGTYRLFACGTTSIWSVSGQELNYGVNDTLINFSVAQPEASELPQTGFAPGRITCVPSQPADKNYTSAEMRLEIQALNVEAAITGVPRSGAGWDVTWLDSSAGWLEGSAYPTWKGNSVLTGHVWNADNTPGIFVDLKTLQYGDKILVHAFGQVYTYEVRESRSVGAKNVKTALKHEELAWLTLLTCEDYRDKADAYTGRRMVRAVLISVE